MDKASWGETEFAFEVVLKNGRSLATRVPLVDIGIESVLEFTRAS